MIGLLDEWKNTGFINVASDYEEACRLLKDDHPDIILLDINLPGRNGIELLKMIRTVNPGCRVIILTNHGDEYYRRQCMELKADHFLDKSLDFEKVPDIIGKMVMEKNAQSN